MYIRLLMQPTRPVSTVCPATPPNLRREFLAFFLGSFVNDLPAGVLLASGMLQSGLGVLRESARAGVILARPRAFARPCHRAP